MVSSRETHLGSIEACVLLSLFIPERSCQKGIPVAGRHDIIYLFCTILPAPSHQYLSFLEAWVELRGTECFFLWYSGSQPYGENNRLIDRHREGGIGESVPVGGALVEEQLTPGFSSAAGIWPDDSSDQ